MKRYFVLLATCILGLCFVAPAQVPQKISYQGLLTTSGGTFAQDGSYNLRFDIYNLPSGGALQYTQTLNGVTVSSGTFSVILGPMPAIFSESLYVQVTALAGSPGISTDITFSPRSELTSAPYALAPWSTNGNNISFTSGNVGVGTSNPTQKLDVSGTVKATAFVGDGSGLTGITGGTGGIANTGSTTIGADTDSTGVGEIALQTGGATRLTVENSGNVTIAKNLVVVGDPSTPFNFSKNGTYHPLDLLHTGAPSILAGGITNTPPAAFVAGLGASGSIHVKNINDNKVVDIDGTYPRGGSVTVYNASSMGNYYQIATIGTYHQVTATNNLVTIGGGSMDFRTPNSLFISDATQAKFFTADAANKRLGIGSPIAPTHTLDVDGDVRIRAVQNALDAQVLTEDANGVIHYRDASTLSGGGNGWSLTGNTLTGAQTTPNEFLGSTSNHDVVMKSNGIERMRIVAGPSSSNQVYLPGSTSVAAKITLGNVNNPCGIGQPAVGINPGDFQIFTGSEDYFSITNTFGTGGTPFMRIQAAGPDAGNVSIGTISNTNILTVQQNSVTDPIADAWTTYSSRRWKTNIKTIDRALDKVEHLRGVYYDWKKDGKHDIGLIAEEVGEVIPEVVAYEENGKDAKSVDYARLVSLLIEGMKEQNKKIEQLEAMVKSLVAEKKEAGNKSLGSLR